MAITCPCERTKFRVSLTLSSCLGTKLAFVVNLNEDDIYTVETKLQNMLATSESTTTDDVDSVTSKICDMFC